MTEQFEQFIKERQFISNVSPRTIQWYRESFAWLDNPEPTLDELKSLVIRMREHGLKPASCNNRIRALNAYLHWKTDGISKCGAGCKHPRVPKVKEEQRVLPTYDQTAITKLMGWKPKTEAQTRLQTLVMTLADIGARIDEVLNLQWTDIDFNNLLVTLHGKGSKDRIVPFSVELRRFLFKWQKVAPKDPMVFVSRNRTKLGRRDVLRDVKELCRSLGFNPPERSLHAFRHTTTSRSRKDAVGEVRSAFEYYEKAVELEMSRKVRYWYVWWVARMTSVELHAIWERYAEDRLVAALSHAPKHFLQALAPCVG